MACKIIPDRGVQLFNTLKKQYGRTNASVIFNRVTGQDFQSKYRDSLTFDSEGIPTFDSVINIPIIRNYLGEQTIINAYQKEQPIMNDTLENTSILVSQAEQFNKQHNDVIAIVDWTDNNKITIKIHPKNEDTIQNAKSQLGIQKLNERIAQLLAPIGITIDMLSEYETSLGRVGITNFQRATDIANGFTVMMQVANNMEGSQAISEEFAHFIIGINNNKPLVQRSIQYLKEERNAREVLGEQYDQVYEYYDGDADMIAEEAAGHLLQQALINKSLNIQSPTKSSLLNRMIDFLLSVFKGLNPFYYQNNIDGIIYEYGKLADDILEGKQKISKEDIQKAKKIASFNALSEKIEVQIKTLKDIVERTYKAAALQDNLDEIDKKDITQKSIARKYAEDVKEALTRHLNEYETMAAIAEYLSLAQTNISSLFTKIQNLDGMTVKDKFTVLRNALYAIQSYTDTIEELRRITNEEFLSDEDIANQRFMLEDIENTLTEFESSTGVQVIDTSSMTTQQIADTIISESEKIVLSDDETHYINTETGQKNTRVTKTIEADAEGEAFDQNSPWVTPSTNIGTGVDELTRDFLNGALQKQPYGSYTINGKQLAEVYPNASNKQLNEFVRQLEKRKQEIEARGITLITRDVIANGTIDVIDGTGTTHTIAVAGTLDLLGYDKDGNWYIYDMKTHRGFIDTKKEKKWRRQLSVYKRFLEEKYGIKVKEIGIIPIKVEYDTPKGYGNGVTEYTVSSEEKNESYNGRHNNQLIVNGEEFRGANPQLEDMIMLDEIQLDIKYSKLANDPTNGIGNSRQMLHSALDNTSRLYSGFIDEFSKKAVPEFLNFLKPFVGENIKIADPKNKGKMKIVSIKTILQESASDISMMQRYFSSMADNPDGVLQIFDKVVKRAKDEKRIRVIEKSQEIIALAKEFEKRGVTSYEWMFETDKKNYIDKEYDYSAYRAAKAKKQEELDNKYGKHPAVGSQEYKDKKNAMKQWTRENTTVIKNGNFNKYVPKKELYPSKWDKLSDTQQEFYDRWMSIKAELDVMLGPGKTHLTNTIKIRKSGIERLTTSLSGDAIMNFIESTKEKFQRSFDDDVSYKDAKGIMGFDGREVMKLPLYYLYGGKGNMQDLSTDVIGTLIAYADMAYNYDAMNQILNPLEIGREILKDRKIQATRGNKAIKEVFRYAGVTRKNDIMINYDASNFRAMIDEFFESKVYNRYLKDNGEFAGIDINKASGLLLKLGSTVQLGFNFLAHLANVGTGVAMQNIEAAAGEHFKARQLAKADGIFIKEMASYMGDIGQRVTKSKLALFDQMFDVRQNFKSKIKQTDWLNKTILTRIFGPAIQYLGQDAGDHWMYNRTAIAMALNHEMLLTKPDGSTEIINLWDALEVVPIDVNNPEAGNKLVLKDGVTNKDGSRFSTKDISDISGNMRYVNQHLFGIYNDEDSVAARRTIWGRFVMQYRDWIPAQFRYRFGAMTTNLEKGGEFEGYYRTSYRFLKQICSELKNGEQTIPQVWNDLSDTEKANVKRSIAEVLQLLAVYAIVDLLEGNDKNRPWAVKYLSYLATREKMELGALVPFVQMPKEMIKIAKSPFAATNVLDDISGLFGCLNPFTWTDEIQSGDYKGHSSGYRAFMKSPLTLWYKTIKRSLNPEKSESYFDQN